MVRYILLQMMWFCNEIKIIQNRYCISYKELYSFFKNMRFTKVYFQGWTDPLTNDVIFSVPKLNDECISKHPINLQTSTKWLMPHFIFKNHDKFQSLVKYVNFYSIDTTNHTQACFQANCERCIDGFKDGCHFKWYSKYITFIDGQEQVIDPNDFVSNYTNIIVKYYIQWISWPCVKSSCPCHTLLF